MKPDSTFIPSVSENVAYWKTFVVRFWSKVNRKPTGCWEWTGSRDSIGYGHVSIAKKMRKAHRVSYFLAHGDLPAGLTVDHLCRNLICVNPDHLEMVTHAENMRRGISFSAKNHKKTHCPRGHAYDGKNSRGARICLACEHKRCSDWYTAHGRVNK